MDRGSYGAWWLIVVAACASGPGQRPQACAADTDCASDAHCRDGVCLADSPPQARISGPASGATNVEIAFDGSGSSDPDDGIVSYTWSVRVKAASCAPDLRLVSGSTFHALFACPGDYDVILVVQDETGVFGEPAIVPVTIGPP